MGDQVWYVFTSCQTIIFNSLQFADVGYVRWDARSDSVLLSSFRQSFQQLSGRTVISLPGSHQNDRAGILRSRPFQRIADLSAVAEGSSIGLSPWCSNSFSLEKRGMQSFAFR